MPEQDILLSGFSMVTQPVIVISNGHIEFMNPAAVTLASRDLTGSHASMLLPSHVLNVQAESFATTAFIGKGSCAVSVRSEKERKICVLTPEKHSVEDSAAILAKLRSSLSNIRFAASCIAIIGENNNDEKLLDYVSTLNRSYNILKRTVDNVGTLNMLANGALPFAPEAFDVTEVCGGIIDTLRFMIRCDSLDISLHADEHIRIVADRRLFEQLLLNLLSNSIEHCGPDGRIGVSLLRTDKNLVLGVSDDGSGIESELLPGIFEHYKNRSGRDISQSSAGMGLAIVRGIAELHKGAVIIESRGRNMGTSVRVMLSAELAPDSRFSIPDTPLEEEIAKAVLTECSERLPSSCYSNLMDV